MHYNIKTNLFVDIVASDFTQHMYRFFISYNLFSLLYNVRVFISFIVHNAAELCSVTKLFPSANWYEREIWDLFGLIFCGHTDMRRILTDYGFVGHPLKKDYPLSGFIEVRYDEHYKCILYSAVHLIQEFRSLYFDAHWDYYFCNIPENAA
jgi:NADH:ubiquinone oxidoreductase subunit C